MPLRIETPRLVIRGYELSDAPALFEAINASREHLLPWMPWARDGHTDLAATTHYLTTQIMNVRDLTAFASVSLGIFDRASGCLLGATGIHGVHRDTAGAETGYWIRADAAGNGFAPEATAHLLSWAFRAQTQDGSDGGMGLRRIVIYCSSQNVKSRRVPEKLGLRMEVQQREDFFVLGLGVTDRLGWGVVAEEWDCERHRVRGV